MVEVLKDLVAADSECDCVAHLLAVQNFLLIFREFDSINYLQKWIVVSGEHAPSTWRTWRNLHKTYARPFDSKKRYKSYNAVPGDMKLEQTTQLS